MTRNAAVVAITAGSLSLGVAAPAAAEPAGQLCRLVSMNDPLADEGEIHIGDMSGGPITDTEVGATITLTCTVQVGANMAHAGPDAASLSNTGTGVATVAGHIAYVLPESQPAYVCTEVTVNGTPYYYDGTAGQWSFDSGVPCGEMVRQEVFPGPLGPVVDLVPCVHSWHPPYWEHHICIGQSETTIAVFGPGGVGTS